MQPIQTPVVPQYAPIQLPSDEPPPLTDAEIRARNDAVNQASAASTPDDGSEAKTAEQKRLAALRGRSSTVLTGPQGLLDAANTGQRTLLGA